MVGQELGRAALANAEAFFEPEAAKALKEGEEPEAGAAAEGDEKKPAKAAKKAKKKDDEA